MLNFKLPRTNIRLYEDIRCTRQNDNNNDNKKGGLNPIIGTRNIYIDNIINQINYFKYWDIVNHICYPYEFIGDVVKTTSQDVQSNHFFSLRYAMHLELHHFIKHEILHTNIAIKTLVFYGDDKYNLNGMNYLKSESDDNTHICINYDSTNINKILSKNFASIDHIVIGSHSVDDNEADYARISYISVLYALCFQKYNGSSLIKLYNIDTPLSIGILGILSSMYLEVHLIKPMTSKSDSSEIFVVCKNFLHKNSNMFYTKFMNIIRNLTENEISKLPSGLRSKETTDKIDYEYKIFLGGEINLQLINKINEFSIIFYQRRLEYIHTILNTSFIQYQQSQSHSQSYVKFSVNENNTKINAIIKNNIQKCLEWISKYHKTIHINLSTEINTIVLRHLNDITSRIDL
jgi:23S rRNA U2552 (ribose-2'-O)-methylase RlmE/FtsJ